MSASLNQTSAALLSAPATMLRTANLDAALTNGVCKSFIVGTAGNVTLIAEDDTVAVLVTGLQAGQVVPIRVKQINSSGTTCTGIVAMY